MLKLKIKIPTDALKKASGREPVKAFMKFEDYNLPVLRVLGVPFGGPIEGRDEQGEAFYSKTAIWLNEGESVPVTYYHGYGPDDPMEIQDTPVVIGMAKYTGVDKKGHWFDVRLDEGEQLALRILANIESSRASSGAVGHLVRMAKSGLIDVWPVGELALFDTNDWRLPANDYAVIEIKREDTLEAQAKSESKPDSTIKKIIKTKGKIMEDKDKDKDIESTDPEIKSVEVDYDKIGTLISSAIEPMKKDLEGVKAVINEPPKDYGSITIKTNPVTGQFSDNEQTDAYVYWLKTGDRKAVESVGIKAALQEGTATEGGYIVPDDFYAQIIAKRDQGAVARKAGAKIIKTSLDVVNVPVEGTAASFAFTAEEAAYNESEPMFDQVAITVYKSTMLIKISEELAHDQKANLDGFLSGHIGKRWAIHENAYTIAGTGSSQPEGILVGGTAGLTLDDTNTIGVTEIPELFHTLNSAYQPGAVWTMQQATFGHLQGLTGNQFQMITPPVMGDSPWRLWGAPVYPSASMEAYSTTGKKSLCYGNWDYYGLVESEGLSISRNPWLYQANGQIALFVKVRWGGAVLQAEAFQYATQA